MAEKHIHIVSFNVPYPPDYGGVIDVYYKIRALHAAGIQVHLHCYAYGRIISNELASICTSVYTYTRKPMWQGFLTHKPFIVSSRNNRMLLHHLMADDYPVLFEGLHCCYFLDDPALQNRIKLVRMHNDEPAYYYHLAKNETRFFTKLYFYEEYKRLYRYEKILRHADTIFCIAKHETEKYNNVFSTAQYLAPFHGNSKVTTLTGSGTYALYHGNLSVNENAEAVSFLLDVFHSLNYKLIIAGKNPSNKLKHAITSMENVTLYENMSAEQLDELMLHAHMHVLPSVQSTGIKLKFINALYKGRYVITNAAMAQHTGLEKYCIVTHTIDEMRSAIMQISKQVFNDEDLAFRKLLEVEFSDSYEIQKIINAI